MTMKIKGRKLDNSKMTDNVKMLIKMVNEHFDADTNSILVNKFYAGQVLPSHADNESILFHRSSEIETSNIISISASGTAEIQISLQNRWRKAGNWDIVSKLQVEKGSSYRMDGYFQRLFLHSVRNITARVSFTFRKVF